MNSKPEAKVQVFYKRPGNSFSHKYADLWEALDSVIRARGLGYDARVVKLKTKEK